MPAPVIHLDYTPTQKFKLKRGKHAPLFLAHLSTAARDV